MKSSILSLLAGVATLLASTNAASEPYPAMAEMLRRDGLNALVLQGCYSSVGDMVKSNVSIYNTEGSCQTHCVSTTGGTRYPVLATQGQTCYCGEAMPASSTKTDNSSCSTICPGYGAPDMCGGSGVYSVWLTGEAFDSDESSSSVTSSSATSSSASTPTTGAAGSTVTKDGQTIVITAPAATSNSSSSKASSGGSNKTAIAVGVVIGVVILAALGAGGYFFMRHRKRRQIEEEYQRNAAVSSFISGGKPPTSSGSGSFNDPRIDPAVLAQRRMSDGSIADNQDYSRRILKVTNA
eukprot:c53068_g1_i1.p1 GENE.c53068_g1_i1~~c53068_g1_i1.p1  ORF type:complete len:295 (+),score=13.41 c53068_g1_i1:513-1397(+)